MSKHFKKSEYACKHCGKLKYNPHLNAILEFVRYEFESPVVITSGYRCPEHNKNVGGAKNSKHMLGIAADIKVSGVSPEDVYKLLDEAFPGTYGIGLYPGWVHIDVREDKARWDNR